MAAMGEFSIGGTVRKLIAILRSNQRAVLISLGAFSFAPAVFFGVVGLVTGRGTSEDWMQAMRGSPGENVVTFILSLFASSTIIYVGVKSLNGEEASFEEGFNRARQIFLSLAGLSIVTGLGILVGFALLIVPGIFLAVVWSAAQPVRVLESIKAMDAISRSWRLTEGYRWPILGVLAITAAFYIAALIVVGIAGAVLGLLGAWIDAVILTPLLTAIFVGVSAAAAAAIYHELLALKEGGGTIAADIFS